MKNLLKENVKKNKNNCVKKHLTPNYMYTQINIKKAIQNIYTNLKIILSVLPVCTIAIKVGHAGIVDLSI